MGKWLFPRHRHYCLSATAVCPCGSGSLVTTPALLPITPRWLLMFKCHYLASDSSEFYLPIDTRLLIVASLLSTWLIEEAPTEFLIMPSLLFHGTHPLKKSECPPALLQNLVGGGLLFHHKSMPACPLLLVF